MTVRDPKVLAALIRRRDETCDWLRHEAPVTIERQAHLDEGSAERSYWHHGYKAALDDVIDLVRGSRDDRTSGRSTH